MDNNTVLVVDDEPQVREFVARVISEAGHRVVTAKDGEEALAVAGTLGRELTLLVTDVRMPGLDGITLAARLLDLQPQLPVLFMSGYVFEIEGGAVHLPVLRKPFTEDELRHRLGQSLPPGDESSGS